jgi:hypothetical protein
MLDNGGPDQCRSLPIRALGVDNEPLGQPHASGPSHGPRRPNGSRHSACKGASCGSPVGRHSLAAIKAPVLLRGPRLLAPRLKVCLDPLREEDAPLGFERGSSFVKARRGAAGALARLRARIESAAPFPLGSSARIADALHDGAGEYVAIVDAPSLLGDVWIEAAGESGHDLCLG